MHVIFPDLFAHRKTSKIWSFQKSYVGEALEEVMEICPVSSRFYVTDVKLYDLL